MTWSQLKSFYQSHWKSGDLVEVIFAQAIQKYGDLETLRRFGYLHEAGNYLVLNFAIQSSFPCSLSLFIHKVNPQMTYLNLCQLEAKITYRIPELHKNTALTNK